MNNLRLEELSARLPAATVISGFDCENNELFQAMSQFSNNMIPGFCNLWEFDNNGYALVGSTSEQYALGVSNPHPDSKEPSRIFVANGSYGELQAYGVVEGVQFNPRPFVGYIETIEQFRRQHKAARILAVMNAASHAVYGKELSSGPEYYINANGMGLQVHMQDRYKLSTDEDGQVIGR